MPSSSPLSKGNPPEVPRARAVVGEAWSTDLVSTLHEVYGPLLSRGVSLEQLGRWLTESNDDRSGD